MDQKKQAALFFDLIGKKVYPFYPQTLYRASEHGFMLFATPQSISKNEETEETEVNMTTCYVHFVNGTCHVRQYHETFSSDELNEFHIFQDDASLLLEILRGLIAESENNAVRQPPSGLLELAMKLMLDRMESSSKDVEGTPLAKWAYDALCINYAAALGARASSISHLKEETIEAIKERFLALSVN